MIILEGMDGSGKTTLANKILESLTDHEISKISKESKPTPQALNKVWKDCGKHSYFMENVIRDRYSLISELVYGPVLRKGSHYGTEKNWDRLLELIYNRPFYIIYCSTTVELCQNRQMEGVKEFTLPLIKRYSEVMSVIRRTLLNSKAPGVFLEYDWRREDSQSALDEFLSVYRNRRI